MYYQTANTLYYNELLFVNNLKLHIYGVMMVDIDRDITLFSQNIGPSQY